MFQHVGSNLAPQFFWSRWTPVCFAFPIPCKHAMRNHVLTVQLDWDDLKVLWLFCFFSKRSFLPAGGAGPHILLTSYCPVVNDYTPIQLFSML